MSDGYERVVPAHLLPTWSDRGFLVMPAITGGHDGQVQLRESSNADGPHIWVDPDPNDVSGGPMVELELDAAQQLVEQLQLLIEHHYQVVSGPKRFAAKDAWTAAGGGNRSPDQD